MVSKVSKQTVKSNKHKVISKKGSKKKKFNINNKLDKILSVENQMLREEKNIEREEKIIESKEKEIDNLTETLKREESDIEKLEKIEEEIKAEVGVHPLAQVTLKDVTKGLIGSFIGLAIHYTFVYGVEIAENLTMMRATIMFPLTFLIGILFIYATGFRKVQDTKLLVYMPIRLLILYICALIMSILVLYLFYPSFGHTFEESYKMVAGVMLAAVVGACTADLIGKD